MGARAPSCTNRQTLLQGCARTCGAAPLTHPPRRDPGPLTLLCEDAAVHSSSATADTCANLSIVRVKKQEKLRKSRRRTRSGRTSGRSSRAYLASICGKVAVVRPEDG